ncbi:MAG TPA: GNAT family protein [Bryobacteraceae bacterium]|nr:GNAT family protein [Bryobacteraceae bacterium]
MLIRVLTPADAISFSKLRRERLEQAPRAFAESLAEHDALPLSKIAERLAKSTDNFVLGAFTPKAELIGMAGFARNPRLKSRHKGTIWGVYVRPRWRGSGVGRALLSELIKHARAIVGLEQIHLTVSTSQTAARQLYESLGFEVFGQERHALKVEGEYVDENHMVLWFNTS